MKKLYLLLPVMFIVAAGCGSDSALAPAEAALFFEGTVYDDVTGVPVITFTGEAMGHGWSFAPDPDRPHIEVPEGAQTAIRLYTGTNPPAESGFADVMVSTYNVDVPPGPMTFPAGRLDDPTASENVGILSGRFGVAHDFFSERAFYDVVDGYVKIEDITRDGPASGILVLVGEAREAYDDFPQRLRLEGTFQTHKARRMICTLVDPECMDR